MDVKYRVESMETPNGHEIVISRLEWFGLKSTQIGYVADENSPMGTIVADAIRCDIQERLKIKVWYRDSLFTMPTILTPVWLTKKED